MSHFLVFLGMTTIAVIAITFTLMHFQRVKSEEKYKQKLIDSEVFEMK